MARIGVFGGTFDPPHLGHLIVAEDAAEALDLDRLLLVPAADPPHKGEGPWAPPELRARMLEAAVRGSPRLEVSRLEIERGGVSYTADTLRSLREAFPDDEIHLLIGVDQLVAFSTWREPREIVRLARLSVMARGGRDPADPGGSQPWPYRTVPVTRIDLSSTEIRRRLAEGLDVRYRVPDAVRRIIEEEGLYLKAGSRPRAGVGAADR